MKPSAESVEPFENPYASPRSVEIQSDAETLLRATTKLYRRMGWAGATIYLVACLFNMIALSAQGQLDIGPALGMTTTCALVTAFFLLMIKTAKDLAVDVDRTYRRARWLAVLAAGLFFPILTIPAYLAVRRLERYRRFMSGETNE